MLVLSFFFFFVCVCVCVCFCRFLFFVLSHVSDWPFENLTHLPLFVRFFFWFIYDFPPKKRFFGGEEGGTVHPKNVANKSWRRCLTISSRATATSAPSFFLRKGYEVIYLEPCPKKTMKQKKITSSTNFINKFKTPTRLKFLVFSILSFGGGWLGLWFRFGPSLFSSGWGLHILHFLSTPMHLHSQTKMCETRNLPKKIASYEGILQGGPLANISI